MRFDSQPSCLPPRFRPLPARLSDCIHAIDEAPSLGAVLTVVAGCARLEAGRAAMILVNDGTLSAYPSRAEVPPDQARLATSAAQKGIPVVEPEAAAFPIVVGRGRGGRAVHSCAVVSSSGERVGPAGPACRPRARSDDDLPDHRAGAVARSHARHPGRERILMRSRWLVVAADLGGRCRRPAAPRTASRPTSHPPLPAARHCTGSCLTRQRRRPLHDWPAAARRSWPAASR